MCFKPRTHRNDSHRFFHVSAQVVGSDSLGFRYDADGLLTGAGALTITRDPRNGLATGTTLGSLTTSQGFNTYGERTGINAAFGTTTLFKTSYTRDDAGRIRSLTETVGEQTRTFEYGYDAAGRLREVKQDGAVAAVYEYDDNGNRKRVTTAAGVVEASTDAQDRLTNHGDAAYGYTPAGELSYKAVGADTTRYRYDALGNLLEVVLPGGSRVEYVIDAENRRVGRKVDGRLVQGFLWEGALRPVAELDSAGAVVARFVYGERPNVPEYMTKGGRTYRLVQDHLGSVRLVVDVATGEVMQRIDYDAYGQVVQDTGPGFQPFGYAGGLYDERTGLVRFGARDYDARIGRWTTRDPVLFSGGDPNVHAYVLGDPVNLVDMGGRMAMAADLVEGTKGQLILLGVSAAAGTAAVSWMSKWNWRDYIDADDDDDYAPPTPRGNQCRPDEDEDDMMSENSKNDQNFHDAMRDEGITRGLGNLIYYTYRNRMHDFSHTDDCDHSYSGFREFLRTLKEELGWPPK